VQAALKVLSGGLYPRRPQLSALLAPRGGRAPPVSAFLGSLLSADDSDDDDDAAAAASSQRAGLTASQARALSALSASEDAVMTLLNAAHSAQSSGLELLWRARVWRAAHGEARVATHAPVAVHAHDDETALAAEEKADFADAGTRWEPTAEEQDAMTKATAWLISSAQLAP
jgi:hypothetical protein